MLKPYICEVRTKLCKITITTFKHGTVLLLGQIWYCMVELVTGILNLCIQCLTEFLEIRTQWKIIIVG